MASLGVLLCACVWSGAAVAESGSRATTCAAIRAEARALVEAAIEKTPVPPSVDTILAAIAPIGTCVEPVMAGWSWALVLTDPPSLETQNLASGDDDETATAVAAITAAGWTPVVVTADGRRLAAASTPELPSFDSYLDANGDSVSPAWPHDDLAVTVAVSATPTGGAAAFMNEGVGLALLRYDGHTVQAHPAQSVLPLPTGLEDINGDGRGDLADELSLRVHLLGDGNYATAFALRAVQLADGSFTTDHPAVRQRYGKECGELGRSPWVLTRSVSEAVTNVACARVFGVPVATIRAGLAAEKASVKDSDDETTVPAIDLLRDVYTWMVEWLDEALPTLQTRDDGLRRAPVATASESSAVKAFGVYRFDAAQAIDGDRGTAWQPKKGRDAWIELKLSGAHTITALDIANGFQRTDALGDLFAMNSRPTGITVSGGGQTAELSLDPTARGVQHLALPTSMTTDVLRITIRASAKGSRWDQVAISELVPLTR